MKIPFARLVVLVNLNFLNKTIKIIFIVEVHGLNQTILNF